MGVMVSGYVLVTFSSLICLCRLEDVVPIRLPYKNIQSNPDTAPMFLTAICGAAFGVWR